MTKLLPWAVGTGWMEISARANCADIPLEPDKPGGLRWELYGSVRVWSLEALAFVREGLPTFADYPVIVNSPFPASVYCVVGILRAWPGPATEVTCSRQA